MRGHSEDLVPADKEPLEKPFVRLTGEDGNAFAIIGRVRDACRKAGWPKHRIDEIQDRMRSGDYDNLLQVVMRECDWE